MSAPFFIGDISRGLLAFHNSETELFGLSNALDTIKVHQVNPVAKLFGDNLVKTPQYQMDIPDILI